MSFWGFPSQFYQCQASSRAHLCPISAASRTTVQQLKAVTWKQSTSTKHRGQVELSKLKNLPSPWFSIEEMGLHYKDNAWKSAWAGNSTPSMGSHPFNAAAGKGFRTRWYIWIKGLFTENCVCIVYFWKVQGKLAAVVTSGEVKWVSREQGRLFMVHLEFGIMYVYYLLIK